MASNQETQGLLSPWIRDRRLREVARRIEPDSVVLDLACGAGALSYLLPKGCSYFGVDRIPRAGTCWQNPGTGGRMQFMQVDLSDDGSPQAIAAWMGARADVITMAAFLEHIKDPASFVSRYMPLLKRGGRIVGTTPHPRGRWVHDALASIGVCSKDGAEEHELFLGRPELVAVADACGAQLSHYQVFLLGLNQAFEFAFPASRPSC